ncbi:hypothetical protein [Sporosarcina sp. FSL W7-1283]|uniref:hypothetical protein n=1 Tax=Sporosarcina sp. FSL W7-1283 TaxID=2921560 RepID=UPI0030F630DC
MSALAKTIITPLGFEVFLNAIAKEITGSRVLVNGVATEFELYKKTVEGNRLRVFLLLNKITEGEIKDFRLIDRHGRELAENIEVLQKTSLRGLLVRFEMAFVETPMKECVKN